MKLRAMREGKLRCLLGHRAPNRSHAMPDVDHGCLTGSVQVSFAVNGSNPATFSAHSNGIFFFEIAREQRSIVGHGVRILAEPRSTHRMARITPAAES